VARAPQPNASRAPFRSARALLALCALLAPQRAGATYSIVALDLASGQSGGAGTSCVGSQLSVYEIFGAAPGSGVVVAQAALNGQARDRAVQLLMQGADAPDVIDEITAPGFDPLSVLRQYAVIDARGVAAGFTGGSTMAYADDVQGRTGEVVYSAQGNILTGAAVLDQAAGVFATGGCDLAETLMLALEGGANGGQGDSRCTPDGIPSDGAFIRVDLADGSIDAPYLELQVDDTRPDSPIAELRALYDAWRGQHPCPAPPDPQLDAGAGPTDAATPDAAPAGAGGAVAGAGGSGGAGAAGAGAAGASAGSAAPMASGSGGAAGAAGFSGGSGVSGAGAAGASALPPGASGGSTDRSGCATAPSSLRSRSGAGGLALAALGAAFALRRRARRGTRDLGLALAGTYRSR
jgi:uncharacterized Ntn-hydrolase superfamily protein